MKHFGLYIVSILVFIIYDMVMTPRAVWRAYRAGQLSKYWYNLSVARDQYSNAKSGGNPDQTVSGQSGIHLENGSKGDLSIRVWLCKVLDYIFREKYHCTKSIDRDEEW